MSAVMGQHRFKPPNSVIKCYSALRHWSWPILFCQTSRKTISKHNGYCILSVGYMWCLTIIKAHGEIYDGRAMKLLLSKDYHKTTIHAASLRYINFSQKVEDMATSWDKWVQSWKFKYIWVWDVSNEIPPTGTVYNWEHVLYVPVSRYNSQ